MRKRQMSREQRQVLIGVLQAWRKDLGYRQDEMDSLSNEDLLLKFDDYRGFLKDSGNMGAIEAQRETLLNAGLILLPEDRMAAWKNRSAFQKAIDFLFTKPTTTITIGERTDFRQMLRDVLSGKAEAPERSQGSDGREQRGIER